MSESFTTTINGYIVTVWMVAYDYWTYRITYGREFYTGMVKATNRVEAANRAMSNI